MADNERIPEHLKAAIEQGILQRGWIANSYAQIEFLLGDFILRCRTFREYPPAQATLSHSAPKRVKQVRQIIGLPGPLDPYREAIATLLDRFEENHETRNIMAHGFCTFVRAASGEMGFEFLKFERHSEYDDMLKRRAYRLEEFAAEADKLKALANDGVLLFRDIHDAFRWTG